MKVVRLIVRRITNLMWGVKGLKNDDSYCELLHVTGLQLLQVVISVRAVQGISHRKNVFPQTLPDKLSSVTSK